MGLIIENIRSDDALTRARTEAFLLENADPGVRLRPHEQLDRAIDSGQGLLISDNDRICGVSLVYQYDPGNNDLVSYEIGTMRITAGGYRLQEFLAKLHLVQIFLEDDNSRGDIFAVVSPGTASHHNLEKHVAMISWTPPDLLAMLRRNSGVPFAPEKLVLRADEAAIKLAFAGLRSLHIEDNRFETPKGNSEIKILMGWFNPAVLDIFG